IVDSHIIPVDDFGTVVDLYADWCPPCKKLKPIFEQLKVKYEGKLNFVSINTDQYKNVAEAYNISSIPTLLFISADGKELGRMVGYNPAEEIESQLASFFPEELK
ncbi:MAG: thioredoxin family protein, partial [Muribaculaceae bacterium]|nr:thioredoxin family protein [Muribaculaceae bacterium]